MTGQPHTVLRFVDTDQAALSNLLARFGMHLKQVTDQQGIPGSFWGDEEAGLIADDVLVRSDTPVHSILHEACHYICMDSSRRTGLDTNAGGDYDEENAVCYLQILLAAELPDMGSQRMMQDMDAWGYSFRLGSAQSWFEQDAEDALQTLLGWNLINTRGEPTFNLRKDSNKNESA